MQHQFYETVHLPSVLGVISTSASGQLDYSLKKKTKHHSTEEHDAWRSGTCLVLLYTNKIRANRQCSGFRKKETGTALAWPGQPEDICSISPHLKTSEKKKKKIYNLNVHCRIVDISDWLYKLYLYWKCPRMCGKKTTAKRNLNLWLTIKFNKTPQFPL